MNKDLEPQNTILTFSHEIRANIDDDTVAELCSILNASSMEELRVLCPHAKRNEDNEELYHHLDQLILPHVSLAIFFDNFSNPALIFNDHEDLCLGATNIGSRLRACCITFFALEEGDSDSGLRFTVAVQASFNFEMVDGINLEGFDGICDSEEKEQIFELKNMFNFFFNDFELDDEDEALNHEWSVERLFNPNPNLT